MKLHLIGQIITKEMNKYIFFLADYSLCEERKMLKIKLKVEDRYIQKPTG